MTKNLFVFVVLAALAVASPVAASGKPDPRERLISVAKMVDELKPKIGVTEPITINNMPLGKHLVGTQLFHGELTTFFSDEVLLNVSDDVLRAIVAHELGHVKLGHVNLKKGLIAVEQAISYEKEADGIAGKILGKQAVVEMIRVLDGLLKKNNMEKEWARQAVAERIQAIQTLNP